MTTAQPTHETTPSAPADTEEPAGAGAPSSSIGAALRSLAEAEGAPPAQQVAPLTQVHRVLRETLDSIGNV